MRTCTTSPKKTTDTRRVLAKNKNSYHNLAKLASKAYMDGFYYVPRIDRALVEEFKEDLVVLTGGLFGEVPSLVLNVGENQAEEACVVEKPDGGRFPQN